LFLLVFFFVIRSFKETTVLSFYLTVGYMVDIVDLEADAEVCDFLHVFQEALHSDLRCQARADGYGHPDERSKPLLEPPLSVQG
jgi:hypothetical protein